MADYREEILPHTCGGRLTLQQGVPVPTSDVTAAARLYFTPFVHNTIRLYDGRRWRYYEFAELDLSLDGLITNRSYNVYAVVGRGGKVSLELGAIWEDVEVGENLTSLGLSSISNASPRVVSTGAVPPTVSTDDLVLIAGSSVSSNNALWRVGTVVIDVNSTFQLKNLDGTNSSAPGSVGSNGTYQQDDAPSVPTPGSISYLHNIPYKTNDLRRLLVGAIRMHNTTGQSQDIPTSRLVANIYNLRPRRMTYLHPGPFTYTVVVGPVVWDDNFANRLEFLSMASRAYAEIRINLVANNGAHSTHLGDNTRSAYYSNAFNNGNSSATSGDRGTAWAQYLAYPGVGFHTLHALESGSGTARSGGIEGVIQN